MPDPLPSRGLAAFAAAAEAGSIHGAAEALDLTPSAATKRIQGLERRLGVSLLIRDRHGVRLSEQGMALYPEARRSLDALARAESSVLASRTSSPLRIIASHTVGECLLPDWLAGFRALAPRLHPQVGVANSPAVVEAVRTGEAEVGFVEGLDSLEALDALEVARDEIVLVVAAGHRWARRRAVRTEELEDGRYVARELGSGTRAVVDARLGEAGVQLRPELTVASLEGLKRSIAAGGFTMISRLALEPQAAAGGLLAVPIEGLSIERALTAIRLPGGRHREAGRRFWSWLEQRRSVAP
jgi:DNA-binding transcriptional LysR family regulator